MPIKHLIFSGGGPVGLITHGAIKELLNHKFINYEDIKSIYSTSIGSINGFFFLLNLNNEWIDDFIVKRPWENLLNFSSSDYFNLFFTKGLCDDNFFINCFKPLFLAGDIDINITLKEFYEINKIDWHIFTSNINKFTKVDLSHKTHPDLTIIEAITMSCAIPIIIEPPFYNNEYYIDGGIFCNCPTYECMISEKCNSNEIISFINDKRYPIDLSNNYFCNIQNEDLNDDISNNNLNKNTNIFSFMIYLIKTVFKKIMIDENEKQNSFYSKNSISICITKYNMDINYWFYVFKNKEERLRLINLGKSQGINYIDNFNNDNSCNNINIHINNDISFNLSENIKFENIIN
tara:strand:+ start:4846 stop:5889 length:1044 start_codon:yes stop_codon:yes gene_type:complete